MPIARMLDQGSIEPAAMTLIAKVYDGIICSFGLAEAELRAKELAARVVLSFATRHATLDADQLRAEVVAELKREGLRPLDVTAACDTTGQGGR